MGIFFVIAVEVSIYMLMTQRFVNTAWSYFIFITEIDQSTLFAFIYMAGSRMFHSRSREAEAWFTVCLVNHRRLDQSQENHFLPIQKLSHATSQKMPGY
jgi:hypothetical protein